MIFIRAVLCVACAFATFLSPAHGEPQATIKQWWEPSKPLTPNSTWCDFADDALTLNVMDGEKQLAHENFCSSYGKAKATIARDGRGRSYVLLEYDEGRGTNATTEYLKVFRLASDIYELARVPISWGTGDTQRFTYSYQAIAADAGGLRIVFNGTASGADECCVPPEAGMVISIEPGR